MRRVSGLGLVLFVSACVAPQKVAPPPLPRPTPTPTPAPPPPPADWRDRAYTPGDWSYARTGATSEARYGTPGVEPRLTLACDPQAGQVRLRWPGAAAGPVTFRTADGDQARQAQALATGLEVAFGARDALLDRMAFSRGRFMLMAGDQALILPAWPEVSRVIEDCR